MRLFNEQSIVKLNKLKAEEEGVGNSIASLTSELAKEKVKGMQKDSIIKNLASQLAEVKVDIMQLKGGNE